MDELLSVLRDAIASNATSVRKLANEVGCSRQAIYNILHGTHAPTLPLAERLADAVGARMVVVAGKKTGKIPA